VKRGLRINGGIRADRIRLVDARKQSSRRRNERGGHEQAQEAGLDLVEVAPNSEPPVCRIMDYGKWLLPAEAAGP